MFVTHISELKGMYDSRIEGFQSRFNITKWFTGYIVIHNSTKYDLRVCISTHLLFQDAKQENPQKFNIAYGDRQAIALYESSAYMLIMASSPSSYNQPFLICEHALVKKGWHYMITQTSTSTKEMHMSPCLKL